MFLFVDKDGVKKGMEWISVEDRMPKEYEDVLLYFEYFRYGEYNCWYPTYGIGFQGDGYFHVDGLGEIKVSHWMPLPVPPYMEDKLYE